MQLVVRGPHHPLYNPKFWVTELVGLKALGLTRLPPAWVPPYFVVTTAAQEAWRNQSDGPPGSLLHRGDFDPLLVEGSLDGRVIVRSSAIRETLDERGRYESLRATPDPPAVSEAIKNIWQSADGVSMGVMVQRYVKPLLAGHLSNERRVSRTESDWTFEHGDQSGRFSLRSVSLLDVIEQQLICTSTEEVQQALRRLATYSLKWSLRMHYEWLWDGAQLFVVQADWEDIKVGAPPKYEWRYDPPSKKLGELVVFRELSEVTSGWKKLATSRLMRELELPSVPQYVLGNPGELQRLAAGECSAELQSDLAKLLRWPVVIRTDKQSDFELILPRTDTIRTVGEAFRFLTEVSGEYVKQGVNCSQFAFILHHFIASRASALALATPGEQRVRIDATWGLPEGLRYYPHDSFEVTCPGLELDANVDAEIREHIRCKTHYIDTAASGDWVTVPGGSPLDWTPSLYDDAVREIATYARCVAERVQSTVQVMFFVGVDSADASVLPWIYTKEKHAGYDSSSLRLSGRRLFVSTENDLAELEHRVGAESTLPKSTIVVRPHPSTVRSNEFLLAVAGFARMHNVAVELEGSVLSHNYYVLKREGVRIRAVDPFDPKPAVQKFGKLVRDAIPTKIEGRGELPYTTQASRAELMMLLRAKAVEEALELQCAVSREDSIEELADLFEVIRSLSSNLGLSVEDVIQAADDKRLKRGDFSGGIILHDTREKPLLELLTDQPQARRRRVSALRKPQVVDGTITIPLVPPARSEAGIHTRLSLNDLSLEVMVDYDEKDVRVSIRQRYGPVAEEPPDQMPLFNRKPIDKDN